MADGLQLGVPGRNAGDVRCWISGQSRPSHCGKCGSLAGRSVHLGDSRSARLPRSEPFPPKISARDGHRRQGARGMRCQSQMLTRKGARHPQAPRRRLSSAGKDPPSPPGGSPPWGKRKWRACPFCREPGPGICHLERRSRPFMPLTRRENDGVSPISGGLRPGQNPGTAPQRADARRDSLAGHRIPHSSGTPRHRVSRSLRRQPPA